MVKFQSNLTNINWEVLKKDLLDDNFHNGRTTAQLKLSFDNSTHVAVAFDGSRCIGTGRVLSDDVCKAYVIDVWTHSSYRHQGIASPHISPARSKSIVSCFYTRILSTLRSGALCTHSRLAVFNLIWARRVER